ncbi:RCC1/BLIP-II protein [Hypoxylon sp. EC38]|nr:RCC1/BLIP-II protein [Hypoxylon sp. EC38]
MAPPKAGVSKKQAVTAKAANAKTSDVKKATSKKSTNKDDTSRSTVKRPRTDDQDDAPNATRQKKPRKLDTVAAPSRSRGATAQTAKPKTKTKAKTRAKAPEPVSKPIINTRPTQKLNIFVFGEGRFGELGLGNQIHDGKKPMNVKRPRLNHNLLPDKVGVVQIACGGMHTVALTADNKILTWGVNDLKALGREPVFEDPGSELDGSDDENEGDDYKGLDLGESTPGEVDLSALTEVPQFVQVAATDSASFALTETGDVYGWGTFRGSDGVLGFSQDVKIQPTAVQVAGLKNITSLASSGSHMLALDKDGKVFTWGYGGEYQLGWKPVSRHAGPRATLEPHVCDRFSKHKYAVKIGAGSYHSFYIDNHGKLWAWGLNNFAQTGHPDRAGTDNAIVTNPKVVHALRDYEIVHVAGGMHHSVACTADGKLFTWGRIDGHQVGLPRDAFTEQNTIMDKGKPRILVEPTLIPNVSASFVAVGIDTSIAVTPEGQAYSWGFSENYQTGQGTTDDIETPTLIDNSAIRGEKIVWAGAGGQFSMLASVKSD